MLLLAVERHRGAASPLAPWLGALSPPETPFSWSFAELQLLAGTPLAEAVAAQRRALAAAWPRLAPVAAAAGGRGLTEHDLAWATSVFWSRALTFPSSSDGDWEEGLVPGLDFANHGGAGATVAWRVRGDSFQLVLRPRGWWWPRPLPEGAELLIDYGTRSNEALLFCYGFCVRSNPADALLVAPPLPAPDDALYAARVALLRRQGGPSAAPRAFLPAAALARGRGAAARAAVEEALRVCCPWVLTPAEVASALEGVQPAGGEAARRRTASLLLLLRLLEQRSGLLAATGSAEEDERALADPRLAPRARAAITYRASQKRLAAAYLRIVHGMARAEGLLVR